MHRVLKRRFLLIICPFIGLITLFLALFEFVPMLFPLTKEDALVHYAPSWQIYDRDGLLLREVVNSEGVKAIWVSLEDVDPFFLNAVMAAEDERFYQHRGIDAQAVLRAMLQNFQAVRIRSGASTITMQLARIVKSHRRTLWGKIAQMITARRLEQGICKNEILEIYINRIAFGRGNLGLEAGAKQYFGVSQNLMSKGQMCLLAGIIKGPGMFNPLDNPEMAKVRRHYVVDRMVILDMISEEEGNRIRREPVISTLRNFQPQAMHFTDFILSKKPAPGPVYTSLDNELNIAINNMVQMHIQQYRQHGIRHAAVLVIDNETMEIRGLIGSPDYWDGDKGSNNGVTMLRQPGSALKPFTYGLAFEQGWQPGDIIPDVPINYLGGEDRLYQPQNITHKFYGPVMLQDALARSLNIPAIQLANFVGIDRLLDTLHQCGFNSLDKSSEYYGLGLTLGNGEVSLMELTTAYTMMAHKGIIYPVKWQPGPLPEGRRIFQEETVFLLTHILSDIRLRIFAFGANNPLVFKFPIAIKTGTSENWRDNWTIGYTKKYTVGVWVGSFSGEPTNQFTATAGAGPLFHQVVSLVDSTYPLSEKRGFDAPPLGIVQREVCALSGKTPNEFCPQTISVYENSRFLNHEECDVHKLTWYYDKQGKKIRDVFEYLPPVYAQWEADQGRLSPPVYQEERNAPQQIIRITQPKEGDRFLVEPGYDLATQTIELVAESAIRFKKISWIVNGEVLTESSWPYKALLPTRVGRYEIQAVSEEFVSNVININIY